MRGLSGVKTKIKAFIINEKKILHTGCRLDPLVALVGNVEKSLVLACFRRKCVGAKECLGV